MNTERRKKLKEILSSLTKIKEDLEDLRDDEQMAYDSLPEQFQFTEKAEKMSELAGLIDYAIYPVDEAIEAIDDVFNAM